MHKPIFPNGQLVIQKTKISHFGKDKSKETFWKPSQAEILIDQELFVFNVKPFYLRLRFQQKLTDQEENVKSQFDIETLVHHHRKLEMSHSDDSFETQRWRIWSVKSHFSTLIKIDNVTVQQTVTIKYLLVVFILLKSQNWYQEKNLSI